MSLYLASYLAIALSIRLLSGYLTVIEIGLLRSVERDRGGRRLFTQDDLRWLEFIGRLREMDMPVREMVRYAELREQGDATLAARRELLEAHRQRVRKRMERLVACLTHLDDKIAWYRGQEDDHA